MKKQRVSALLELDTIEHLTKEAKEKSISVSAVIRQKVEAMIKFQNECKKHLHNKQFPSGGIVNEPSINNSDAEYVVSNNQLKDTLKKIINKTDPEFGTGNN